VSCRQAGPETGQTSTGRDDHEQHLELADIAALLGNGDEKVASFCRHLAAVCEPCGEQLRQVEELMKRFRHWNPEVAVLEGLTADGLLAEILETDPATWASQVKKKADLQTWGVAWVALEWAQACEVQGRALQLALLAATIAGHLGTTYHPEWVSDLTALAHATAAAATPPSDAEGRLRQVAAATEALQKGTGEESIAREVVALLARVVGGQA